MTIIKCSVKQLISFVKCFCFQPKLCYVTSSLCFLFVDTGSFVYKSNYVSVSYASKILEINHFELITSSL